MKDEDNTKNADAETQAFLARIQKTIAESKALLSQVELRMSETDRLLESQGLTRTQVEAMQFTDEQKAAVNAELKRRGMDALEFTEHLDSPADSAQSHDSLPDSADSNESAENRRRKFKVMMNGIKL